MQGGTKSLPNTPKEQDPSGQPPQFWSVGPKDSSETLTRPSGVRVKLFEEGSTDLNTKSRKSVHWNTGDKQSDEETQSGESPETYWNVENGVIHSTTDANGQIISGSNGYFPSDDFDLRIAKTVTSQGSNVRATLFGVSRDQSSSGISSLSENRTPGTMSEASVSYPSDMPSQSVIQDRLLRDGHFTSSPKLDKTKSEISRDNSQDISLVSSISAPFELRPKAYDDSVISEENTFVDEPNGELQMDNERLNKSDGAAQLMNMRQEQFSTVPNSVVLPPPTITAVPSSREQLLRRSQSVEEGNRSRLSAVPSKEDLATAFRSQGHNEGFQPLLDDSMMSTDSVNDRKVAPVVSVQRPDITSKQTTSIVDKRTDSNWVDNARLQHQTKGVIHGNGESKNVAIHNLEQVRSHLHNMINMTKEALPDKAAFDQTEDIGESLLDGLVDVKEDESFSSAGSFPVLGGKSLSELESILNIGGGGMHSAGSYLSGSANNSALFSEIQFTKEQLQRERFRRKHCEKQISELQSKMLELQQQLAVAVSTDRKKETMIEHLDKALAKVVDGWKKKDNEKVEIIQRLENENKEFRQKCEQQHEELLKFTSEINDTRERLNLEMNRANKSDQHIQILMDQQAKDKEESKHMLETERLHLSELEMQRNELQEAKDKLMVNLTDLQQNYENDKENWEDKERDYLQKIDEITDNHLKCMDQERVKLEKQNELLNDTQQVLTAAQTEVQNLKMQLDTATREKESLKVEMGLTEARLENSKRKLESDLRSDLERQMTERIEEAHNRQMSNEEELRERHRRQMFELNQRHSTEMEEQLQQYQEDVRRKEEKITHQALSFEEKVTEMKVEMDTMKSYVKKLEGQRLEMTNKLQSMMQTHCNEALRLLQIGSSTSDVSTHNVAVDIAKRDNGIHDRLANEAAAQLEGNSTMAAHRLFQENNNAQRFTVSEVQSSNPSQAFPLTDRPGLSYLDSVSIQGQSVPSQYPSQGVRQEGARQPHYIQDVDAILNGEVHGIRHSENSRNIGRATANNAVVQDVQNQGWDGSKRATHQAVSSRLYYQQNVNQSSSLHETAVPYSQRNPSFFETLAAEADAQDSKRFQILDSDKKRASEDGNFKPLSCDSTMDATGGEFVSFQSAYPENSDLSFSRNEQNRESIDLRLSTGTFLDEENNNSPKTSNGANISAGSQNSTDYKKLEESVNVHEERQTELQHYIKKLLQRSPNSPDQQQEVPTNTPADSDHLQHDQRYFQSSMGSEDKSVTVFSPARAPETPTKPAFHKSLVGRTQFTNLMKDDTEMGYTDESKGVLSPQQVGEISRLLGLYRPGPEGSSNITSAGTTPPMTELLTYLKDLNPDSSAQEFSVSQEPPTRDIASNKPVKRNLSSTYNTSAAKQVVKDTEGSPSSVKGSPGSNKSRTRDQSAKHLSKPSSGQTKQVTGKTNVGNASKKSDKKVVSSKAKHGVWK